MISQAEALVATFTAALPGFLAGRAAALGLAREVGEARIPGVVEAIETDLRTLLDVPFDRQAGTPLEAVRGAVGPLTRAAFDAGLETPEGLVARDDPFGFAPASAGELGDKALEASLAWGLAKTEALSRPLLLVVTGNLMDASRFDGAAASAGYRVEVRRGIDASTTPLVAFVDLEAESSDEAIRSLAADGVRVVAYGPHVDDMAMVRAMALGATAAEPRSRFFRNPAAYLPPLV